MSGLPQLQTQAAYTLQRRVVDLRIKYGYRIAPSTLRRYYLANGIKFRSVNMHSVNKAANRDRIFADQ